MRFHKILRHTDGRSRAIHRAGGWGKTHRNLLISIIARGEASGHPHCAINGAATPGKTTFENPTLFVRRLPIARVGLVEYLIKRDAGCYCEVKRVAAADHGNFYHH